MRDFELERELINNHNDKVTIEIQVENYKNAFAKELINDGVGKEMADSVKFGHQPVKRKKPVKLRISESVRGFKNKLKIVFGID